MARRSVFVFDVNREDTESFRVMDRARDISMWERTHMDWSVAGLERDASLSQIEARSSTTSRGLPRQVSDPRPSSR